MAMFIMAAHGLAFILVPLMALMLTYLEIWPARALGAVFGDPSRLWEYDPDNPVFESAPTMATVTIPSSCRSPPAVPGLQLSESGLASFIRRVI
jgi:hypothetical protein